VRRAGQLLLVLVLVRAAAAPAAPPTEDVFRRFADAVLQIRVTERESGAKAVVGSGFYADADVSADGQSWAAAAGVTDYTNKTWPITYSPAPRKAQRARDFENISFAELLLTEPLALDASVFRSAAAPTRGYLWDNAYERGVSFRDYGLYTKIPGDCKGGEASTVSLTMGVNAPDGKGNITAYATYISINPVTANNYDYTACSLNSGDRITGSGSGNFTTVIPAPPEPNR